MLKKLKISGAWLYLICILIAYIVLLLADLSSFNSSINFFFNILVKIIPIIILVFVLMALTNYLVTPKFIKKHIMEKGKLRKWIFAIITGIISTGSIYMWYPLLADLRAKGISNGLIACFLYNRAIKIPFLPLLILYFNWAFVIVLTIIMIFASVIQGIIINKIMEVTK
jgi:uncharacterized membrane protein YraQ (UPF0718 family)